MRTALARWLRRLLRWLERRRGADAPVQAVLEAMLAHVTYEVDALHRAFARRGGDRLAMEAFFLHARNLRDFLWGEWDPQAEHATSDLFAEHYFPSYLDWRGAKNAPPNAVANTWTAIDKQLSHITTDRSMNAVDLETAADALHSELLTQWNRFMGKLPAGWRGRFDTALASWQAAS